jgi:hypothetical protein
LLRHTDSNEKVKRLAVSPLALLASVGVNSVFVPELTPKLEFGLRVGSLVVENELHRDLWLSGGGSAWVEENIPRPLRVDVLPKNQVCI